ncbi:MAG: ABC transporter permease [Deltaproteobacteria bacterium]|nr:ABC transporter permease [Deltaproteobacteria bacterium]
MRLWQTFRVAVRALLLNKLRSFLTVLGVIIGVGAVIAMVAIGEGAKAMVEQTFASMGSNLLIVVPGSSSRGGAFGGFGSMPSLTWDDLAAVRTELSSVRGAAAVLRSGAQVASEDQNWTTQIIGTSPDYLEIRNWPVSSGSVMTISDVEGGNKVALLGETVVEKIFGVSSDPVGQLVRIRNIPFEVIGVLERKGQSPMGQDYDDVVIVPETTFQARIQGGLQKYVTGVFFVSAPSAEAASKTVSDVSNLLRDRHRIAAGADDDFGVRNMSEMAAAEQQGTSTLTTLLAAIAAVSLVVGGIGIMNIMLVSVTERTREIGLRMAIGATPRNVLAQFLVEALTLSLAGGLAGVGLGVWLAGRLATEFGWPMLIRPDIVALALGFSAFVGVAFGSYPAWKASRLEPIEALRYE